MERKKGVRIPLENDTEFAIVDAEDYQRVSKYKWFAVLMNGKKHAATIIDGEFVLMEEFVLFGDFWKEWQNYCKCEEKGCTSESKERVVKIPLVNDGGFVTVDAQDYERVTKYTWFGIRTSDGKEACTFIDGTNILFMGQLLKYGEFWKIGNPNYGKKKLSPLEFVPSKEPQPRKKRTGEIPKSKINLI